MSLHRDFKLHHVSAECPSDQKVTPLRSPRPPKMSDEPDFHAPEIHSISLEESDLTISDVWSIDEKQVAAGINCKIPGKIACLQRYEEYYENEGEYHPYDYDRDFVESATFKLSITAILDKESGDLEDYRIDDIEVKLGMFWPWPDGK